MTSTPDLFSRLLFPLNDPSFLTRFKIVVNQIHRQRPILGGDCVADLSHSSFAIDEINDLVSVEFGKILGR